MLATAMPVNRIKDRRPPPLNVSRSPTYSTAKRSKHHAQLRGARTTNGTTLCCNHWSWKMTIYNRYTLLVGIYRNPTSATWKASLSASHQHWHCNYIVGQLAIVSGCVTQPVSQKSDEMRSIQLDHMTSVS
jgi:hypothetical protein